MKFSQDFIGKVKQAADIVSVITDRGIVIKHTGSTYKALCPFHSEKTPSFNINPQDNYFHCFGCNISGDTIQFIMEYDKLSFVEAITELANRFAIPLEQDPTDTHQKGKEDTGFQILAKAAQFYHDSLLLNHSSQQGREYLHNRAIPESTWKAFQMGFIPDDWQSLFQHLSQQGFAQNEMAHAGLVKVSQNGRPYDVFRNRIIFPIRDIRGRCIAFGGRIIDAAQQPKYLNSSESKYYHKSQSLYGFYEGLSTIKKKRHLILVEGYLDVTRLHEFGFSQAVATCGTSLTQGHITFSKRYVDKVTLLLDGDQAGQRAALRSCPLFLSNGLDASVVTLPSGEDPDSFLFNQGPEKFQELLQRDTPVFEFLVKQSLAKYSSNVQGRTRAVEELIPMIREIADEKLQQLTLVHLAEIIHLPVSDIIKLAPKALQNPKNHDSIQSFNSSISNDFEDRDEKRILQALLRSRPTINIVRNHLNVEEFITPHFQVIYEVFLKFSDTEFQSCHIEELRKQSSEYSQHIMRIYMEDFIQESQEIEQLIKRSIRRIKERNLKSQLNEILASAKSDEEILQASKDFRIQQATLNQFFPQR